MLVTHDRYMLDRISTVVLGLDGRGGTELFADYLQWDAWQQSQQAKAASNAPTATRVGRAAAGGGQPVIVKKKLSYMEAREFATIEESIAEAEQELHAKRAALEDPAILSDALRLQTHLCSIGRGAEKR